MTNIGSATFVVKKSDSLAAYATFVQKIFDCSIMQQPSKRGSSHPVDFVRSTLLFAERVLLPFFCLTSIMQLSVNNIYDLLYERNSHCCRYIFYMCRVRCICNLSSKDSRLIFNATFEKWFVLQFLPQRSDKSYSQLRRPHDTPDDRRPR